jgi:hypothetical protein
VGFGGKLDQVLVAGPVFGEKDEMVVIFIGGIAAEATARGDINLTANDGLDAGLFSSLVKLDGTVHDAVVGDGQAIHTQFFSLLHEPRDTAHTIQQAVFGVDMEVSKHHTPGEEIWLIIAQGRQTKESFFR